jgi:NAD(P)-dependent dehydrogenase (short-subunit alcohol dehydrogenase family)
MKTIIIIGYYKGILSILAKQFYFSGGVCKSKNRLDGRIVIITGANTGIGYETALELACRGARVIIACRDLKKAHASAKIINEKTFSDRVQVEKIDLASLESVREFAARMNEKLDRLDILINNAGGQNLKLYLIFC